MRLRVQVCVERQAPDGTWAPVMCAEGVVTPTLPVHQGHSLEVGYQAQRAADQLIQEITRIKA